MSKWEGGTQGGACTPDRSSKSLLSNLPPSFSFSFSAHSSAESSPARLAPGETLPSFFCSSSSSSSFVLLSLLPRLYSSSSPRPFVLAPQRFRSPIVPSTFEICEERQTRETKTEDTVRGVAFRAGRHVQPPNAPHSVPPQPQHNLDTTT